MTTVGLHLNTSRALEIEVVHEATLSWVRSGDDTTIYCNSHESADALGVALVAASKVATLTTRAAHAKPSTEQAREAKQ